MTNNKNIAKHVWYFLDRNPCITRNMSAGLINTRALAKYLIKEEKIDTTLDAAISAIRRYKIDINKEIFEKARKIFLKSTALSIRSPLANISIIKDTEVQNMLPKLFSIIHYNLGDVLRIIQGDGNIKIIVDKKQVEKIKNLFSEKHILNIEENLGEINVHIHPDAKYTPGILAYLANEFAINDINVIESISCFPEHIWFLDEKDLQKAYNVLYDLWKNK